MKKLFTALCLCIATLLPATRAVCQTSAGTTVTVKHGIKITVHQADDKTTGGVRLDFVNTTNQDLTFTWSVKAKTGKMIYTSSVVVLKAGATTNYPASGEIIAAQLAKGVNPSAVIITIKK